MLFTKPFPEITKFDVIGDVHGCLYELLELLARLGYHLAGESGIWTYPEDRRVIFVGDYIDRGPYSMGCLRIFESLYTAGIGTGVIGNHDDKFLRALKGNKVTIWPYLEKTLEQYRSRSKSFQDYIRQVLGELPYYLILDDDRLLVTHAGLKEPLQEIRGRDSEVKSFCIYGDVDGSVDEHNYPVRKDWAADYEGDRFVIYGHTPTLPISIRNNTINIDTGCASGGWLTAFRYPEMEIVQVSAREQYSQPTPHFAPMLHRESQIIG